MSFNVKNPLSAPVISKSPPPPVDGSRGLFPMEDGWYDIDDNGIVSKIGEGEQSDWDEDDETSGGFIKNKPTLSKVATSGDYNDLSSIPIEAVTSAEHFRYCITGECSDYTLEILNSLVEPQKIYQWIYNGHASAIIFVLCGATPTNCITQVALLHDGQLYYREYDVMEETWTQWNKVIVSASEFDNVKETAHINANLISNLSNQVSRVDNFVFAKPSTSIPTTLSANTEYSFGEVATLSLAFPTLANDGDVIYLTFKSGEVATTLTIDTTNTTDIEVIPETNCYYDIFAKFNGSVWLVNYSEYLVSEV